jgi:hypothetical protein
MKGDHCAHLNRIYNSQQRQTRPNPLDPRFRCVPCNYSYLARDKFHKHIKQKHKMFQMTAEAPPSAYLPDIYDTKNFCRVCQKTYNNQTGFYTHCRNKHKMKFGPIGSTTELVGSDTEIDINDPKNTSCHICRKKRRKVKYLRLHMNKVHKRNISVEA